MAYTWIEIVALGSDTEDADITEIRTNIDTERTTRASLAAYSWTNVTLLEGEELIYVDFMELRSAIDEAYDLLFECATHYTSDDSTHYSVDDAAHDSAADATHYTTHLSTHYTVNDAAENTTHNTTHYTTADTSDYAAHNAAANSGRKSAYYTANNFNFNGSG